MVSNRVNHYFSPESTRSSSILLEFHQVCDNIIQSALSKDIVSRVANHVEQASKSSKSSKSSHGRWAIGGVGRVLQFESKVIQETICSSSVEWQRE